MKNCLESGLLPSQNVIKSGVESRALLPWRTRRGQGPAIYSLVFFLKELIGSVYRVTLDVGVSSVFKPSALRPTLATLI